MRLTRILVPAMLLTTAFAALAPPAQAQECFDFFGTLPICWEPPLAPPGDVDVVDPCVNYAYVADYHWYWLCVDAKGDCPAYQKEQHGVTVTRTCLVPSVSAQTAFRCVFVAQDLDYRHYVCVGDASCPVYTKRVSGGDVDEQCVVELA